MATIFEPFDSKEEALAYIESSLTETEDGKFILSEAVDKHNQYRSEIEQSRKYRQRAQSAEDALAEAKENAENLMKEKALVEEKLKQYGALEGSNEELQLRYKDALDRESDLKRELESTTSTLAPLQDELNSLRRNESRRIIQAALYEEAKKAKVRPEAYEDVDSLIDAFEIDSVDGTIRSKKEGLRVGDFLAGVLERRKHWLIPSVGTGSDSGNGRSAGTRESMYNESRNKGDILGMVKNAPVSERLS